MAAPARTRTEPVMDNRPLNERWGPEIYVHLEFRVGWTRKPQPAKDHQITYRSRGFRERSPPFPRQVPAPNTNYLAAIHSFGQRQARIREFQQAYAYNQQHRPHHQMQEYYRAPEPQPLQHQQPRDYLQVPVIQEPERPTRADARPSHERGSSAPPPIGENPWDVNVQHDPARVSDMTTRGSSWMEIKRKPLPAAPSQFRLGEGRQPWSTWSLPEGYDPDTYPKDDEEDLPKRTGPPQSGSTIYATNPTMVSTFSPEPKRSLEPTAPAASTEAAAPRNRDVETGRARELGALSAAMMTVDNGFENQWWYQGPRRPVGGTDEPRTPDESPIHRWSTGPLPEPSSAETPRRVPTGVVSPMTDSAFSPAPTFTLQRTMSTRSEELWFSERASRG
ncbi:hypothetical protein MFIFM68171_07446 [Madurella fahalii]|uniref:Uncharacterized protein n=1 Tax=Madurella fahalii TaxID=1157608 RepID=A0ABQ0GHJ5_9PEZI